MNPESPNFLACLTGSFSNPAAENPTVAMVEAAYRHHGLNWRYINCEVQSERLGDAVRGAKAMGWVGFNCSIPHKIAVIKYLDGLGESAEIIGAVNTVVRREGQYIGENTDGRGFVNALRKVIDPEEKTVIIFGAGGAARAVAVEMALAGAARISVVNRSRQNGEELARLLNEKTPASAEWMPWQERFRVPSEADIAINNTSVGLYPHVDERLDVDTDSLMSHMVVADGIPNPPRTHWIRDAETRGCRVMDGLEMLVNQGVIGIKYWTGIDADVQVMRKALESALSL
jgi:shikimate dehydrogenase